MAAFLVATVPRLSPQGWPRQGSRNVIDLMADDRAGGHRGQLFSVAGAPDKPLVPCVGAVITRDDGRLLLVQRGNEPERGRWSLPGGRVEPRETDAEAVAREVLEETGLKVAVGDLAGRVQRGRYDIADYFATVVGGTLAAGTDALDARWADPREMDVTTGLIDTLASWGVTFDES